MNTKIWIARGALTAVGLVAGLALSLIPAIAESVPIATIILPAGGLLLGVFAAWVLVHFSDWQHPGGKTSQGAALSGAGADSTAPVAPGAQTDTVVSSTQTKSIFDDLPAQSYEDTGYRPSFDSVMFALGDVDGDAVEAPAPATPRGKVNVGPSPTVHVAENATQQSPPLMATDASRPIAPIASVSPFGPGVDVREEGSLEVSGGDGSIDNLASMFDSDELSPLDDLSVRAVSESEEGTREETRRVNEDGTGRVDSVAVLSELLGGDDLPQQVPRGPSSRPAPMPRTERQVARETDRGNKPPTSPSVIPPSAAPAGPVRTTGASRSSSRNDVLADLSPERRVGRSATPQSETSRRAPGGSRAQKEQRVITARLQMGMVRREAELDADKPVGGIKDGFIPTPRKDAPDNLILLSRRGEEEAETRSADEIRRLYQEFVEALRQCGRTSDIVQFKSFSSKISSQRSRVRAKYEGAEIEMQVRVSQGRPKIVMRPLAV